MSVKGIGGRRSHKDEMKRMIALTAMAQGKAIKVRKARVQETKPREQPERDLRATVIKYLRGRGCVVKRLENGVWGKLGRGIPDLLFFTPVKGYNCYPPSRFFFLELKSTIGVLRPEQKEFKHLCGLSGTGYILARGVEELKNIIK